MPNKANAWKALRQTKRRTVRNEAVRSNIDYLRRKYRQAIERKDGAKAAPLFLELQKALDRAAGKGVLKENTASRLKSRASAKLKAIA